DNKAPLNAVATPREAKAWTKTPIVCSSPCRISGRDFFAAEKHGQKFKRAISPSLRGSWKGCAKPHTADVPNARTRIEFYAERRCGPWKAPVSHPDNTDESEVTTMTMFNKDQIFQLLESRDGEALRALWQGRGAVDIAALLDSVEDGARQAAVFRTLPKDLAADVFSYLPGPTQATLARSFADGELQQIFDALHLDDAADFLEELPANLVTRILRSASPQRRMAVNALLRYPADSAGSVMTPEFVSLRPGDTVRQALD
ncbi:uridine phosphorylase, partial [Dysosmobacter welbionis]